jgi:AraC family transcriptional regulator
MNPAANPVSKALWFVESHHAGEITLDAVARVAGVSRFHMSRVFLVATGYPVLRYVRGRRLTEAARTLANGAQDILTVALDAGYGSHEAFTRAFRDQFGLTPEAVRGQGHLNNLILVEAITLDNTPMTACEPPRFEQAGPLLLAGLSVRYNCEQSGGIPAQWQRFGPYLGNVPGQAGQVAYGVNYNTDDSGSMDYMCAVEVSEFAGVPPELTRLRVAQQRYVVFFHREHISAIRGTWGAILNKWLPESGHELADAPSLERYDERFNPVTGTGGLEIWIPIAR